MLRQVLKRAGVALDAGPDPYGQLDVRMATKLGGAIYLIGIVYAAIVLPLSPPSGPLGLAGVGLCMLAAGVIGVRLLKRDEPAHPNVLLALCYVGVTVAAVFRASAGPGSPFHELLFLAVMYTSAVHPARRAFGVVAFSSLSALSPLLYENVGADFAALTISHLALTISLSFIILIWTTRVRGMRRESHEAREQADQLARVDALTGLGNRRALEEAMVVAVAAARRDDAPLAVLVGDLDGFKAINDTFGHKVGDDVLCAVARGLETAIRLPDPCFRWAGDEFVALLPGADLEKAREIAERVASTVALAVRCPDGRPARITIGAAALADGDTGEDLVNRADAALLAAKASGRRISHAV